jgi:hypothetical protein
MCAFNALWRVNPESKGGRYEAFRFGPWIPGPALTPVPESQPEKR